MEPVRISPNVARGTVYNDATQFFIKNFRRKRFILGAIILITLFISFGSRAILPFVLFIIGSVSMLYKRKIRGWPIGVEFVTITTFIAGHAYGPIIGALFGLITSVTAQMLSMDYDGGMVMFFVGNSLLGFISAFTPVNLGGIVFVSLFSDMWTQFFTLIGGSEQKLAAGTYIFTHTIFNVVMWNFMGIHLYNLSIA